MVYLRIVDTSQDNTLTFETVDLSEFYGGGADSGADSGFSTNIIVLTEHEQTLINMLLAHLMEKSMETFDDLQTRIENMRRLAESIAYFPSLLQRQMIMGEERTQTTLVESLVKHLDGDKILYLPSKATLGKGFLIVKYHTFSSMCRLAEAFGLDAEDVKQFEDTTMGLLFTMMAEDVYLDLINNTSIHIDIRRRIAKSLIVLWEHRWDQNIVDIAPVLREVWEARRTLAPAFGTMVGTSELLLISIQMGESWNKFLKMRLADKDVSQAMEEFLFGLSYEQIIKLKQNLRERGVAAIGRDEISAFLGQPVKIDLSSDLRDFYMSYSIRRDNARARKRLGLEGPHNTLEDHFLRFIFEESKE